MIESRIQGHIAYVDKPSIYKLYNIHRLAICNLLMFSTRFFGFRKSENLIVKDAWKPVNNLKETIDEIQSDTYVTLCRIAGRPTIKQLCYRACKTIRDQSKFKDWSKAWHKSRTRPKRSLFEMKISDFLKMKNFDQKPDLKIRKRYFALGGCNEKKNFVMFLTKRFFPSELAKIGFTVENKLCRLCSDLANPPEETIDHVIKIHGNGRNFKSLKRQFNMARDNLKISEDIMNIFSLYDIGDFQRVSKRRKISSV